MPAAAQYPGADNINSPEAKKLDRAMTLEMSARRRRIDENIKRYKAETDPPFKDKAFEASNVTLPLCRLVVNKGVAVMTGTDDYGDVEGVKYEVQQTAERQARSRLQRAFEGARNMVVGTQSEEDARQDYLDRFWEANRKNKFHHNFFLGNGLAGHYFLQIQPDALADPRGGSQQLPRVVALDARNVCAFWDEMDAEKVLWYTVVVGEKGKRTRQDVVRVMLDDGREAGRWQILNYTEEGTGGDEMTKWVWDENAIEWNYRWSPIQDGQNLPSPVSMSYYGEDDLNTLGRLEDALSYTASLSQLIQRRHGIPKFVTTGMLLPENYASDPDQAIQSQEPDAKAYYVTPATDGSRAMNQMQFMERQFWNAAREVDPASVAGQLGKMSNFDLRIVYQDALFKRQSKWLDASEILKVVCQAALELGGFGANTPVDVIPPAPLPTNLAETVSAFSTLSQHGLSDDTILERTGYDPEDERAKRKMQEREGAARQTRGQQSQSADESRGFGRLFRRGQQEEQGAGQ